MNDLLTVRFYHLKLNHMLIMSTACSCKLEVWLYKLFVDTDVIHEGSYDGEGMQLLAIGPPLAVVIGHSISSIVMMGGCLWPLELFIYVLLDFSGSMVFLIFQCSRVLLL